MVTQNSIKIRIEATLPLPQKQAHAPMPSPRPAGCGGNKCGGCGKTQTPLTDAGETLLRAAQEAQTLEQIEAALKTIEAALRRYYETK